MHKKSLILAVTIIGLFLFSPTAFAATGWNVVGTTNFSAGMVTYTVLHIDANGTPYISFSDTGNGGKASMMTYNGSSWVNLGGGDFSAGNAGYVSMSLSPTGTPFVAYMDGGNSNKGTVMRYDAVSSTWASVGSAGFTPDNADYTSIVISSTGTPYVAFEDIGNSLKASVMAYNSASSTWTNVGTAGFSSSTVANVSLAISPTDTLFVAYTDAGNSNKATVMTYDGSNWVPVGTPGFSSAAAQYISLAISSSGTLYIAYQDGGSDVTVMTYNGSSWVNVGSRQFTGGTTASYISLAINASGTPYVSYRSSISSNKASVMSYSNGSWSYVGAVGGISPGQVFYTTLAFGPTGTPYLGFSDIAHSLGATVMAFSPTVPDQVTGLTVTPLNSTQISLSWSTPSSNGGSSITGYQIERETPISGGFSVVSTTLSTSTVYTDVGLVASTTYNYRVAAVNSIGTGATSSAANTTTPYTVPPVLISPTSSSSNLDSDSLSISYSLPVAMLNGSLTLTFIPTSGGVTNTITLADVSTGAHSFTLTPNGGVQSDGHVVSATHDTIADGVYTVVISYQDSFGDPAATASVTGVIIYPPTAVPTLISPATDSTNTDTSALTVSYSLPQSMLSGSLVLTFIPISGSTNTIYLSDVSSGSHTLSLTPAGGVQSANGVSYATSDTIADGTYTVTLSYQNSYAAPATSTSNTNVVISAPVHTTSGSSGGSSIVSVMPTAAAGGVSVPLSFSINNGTPKVTNSILTLQLNANPMTVRGFMVSLDPSFTNVGITTYTTNTPITFALPDKSGTYKVFLKYYSTTGVFSDVISQTVTYDSGSVSILPTTLGVSASVDPIFKRTLKFGSRGVDVRQLQIFLNNNGFTIDSAGIGSPGRESVYFGPLLKAAVSKFQEAHADAILKPYGITSGTGIFGPATRKLINQMEGRQ